MNSFWKALTNLFSQTKSENDETIILSLKRITSFTERLYCPLEKASNYYNKSSSIAHLAFTENAKEVVMELRKHNVKVKMKLDYDFGSERKSYWVIERNEENRAELLSISKYNNCSLRREINDICKDIVNIIEENDSCISIAYLINRYEDTTLIVANTLEEALELRGEINTSLKEESIKLLSKFKADIEKVKKEKVEAKRRDDGAIEKSLYGRLKEENDFVDKYIRNEYLS